MSRRISGPGDAQARELRSLRSDTADEPELQVRRCRRRRA
jgi:hypothetical protein